MGSSYVSSLVHIVTSTKSHEPWLKPPIRERLWPYMGGIAKEEGIVTLAVGGYADHAHMLVSLRADISLSRAAQLIKGASSRWIHGTFPELRSFAWQEGYGAFSIGISQAPATRRYIEGQAEHHRKVSFREEYIAFLRKNNLSYDERYVWG